MASRNAHGQLQASGLCNPRRYRYYKCTTRNAKDINSCTSKNLPREKTDALVLSALSERVFTPKWAATIVLSGITTIILAGGEESKAA
jgi:hypothetical protein